ncbi:cellulose-binding protein [Kitasatospora indigofera]|uniref:cellulose-binding protein n=1 Tax=Kitasatospora indigofera TaxID=67307 RepID=UPI003668898C
MDLLAKEPASRPADAGQASARLRGIVRYAQRPTVLHSPTLRDGAPGSGPSDRTMALDPREAEGLRIMEKAMIDSAALLAEANRDAEAKRQAAQTLFEETRAKVAQATRDFETNLATRRAKADRDLAESERVSLESFQAAAVRREEADALFEETRTRAAQAALEFETNLAERREQSERDLAARQAKAEKQLAQIEHRAEQLRLEAEKLRTVAERRARQTVETAQRQSEDIVADANDKAGRIRSESERELAALTKRRDSIHAQVTNVREMLATLTGAATAAADASTVRQQLS